MSVCVHVFVHAQ